MRQTDSSGRASTDAFARHAADQTQRSSGSSRDGPRGATGFRDATPSVSMGGFVAVVEAGVAGIGR